VEGGRHRRDAPRDGPGPSQRHRRAARDPHFGRTWRAPRKDAAAAGVSRELWPRIGGGTETRTAQDASRATYRGSVAPGTAVSFAGLRARAGTGSRGDPSYRRLHERQGRKLCGTRVAPFGKRSAASVSGRISSSRAGRSRARGGRGGSPPKRVQLGDAERDARRDGRAGAMRSEGVG
jgi:hypothetical protein